MPYLIDSDITIDHLAGVSEINDLLQTLAREGLAISVITYMEVLQGCLSRPDATEARLRLETFLGTVPIVPFTTSVAEQCAMLREQLRGQGKRVSSRALDLIIAATALKHDLILVTRYVHDYSDIPGFASTRLAE